MSSAKLDLRTIEFAGECNISDLTLECQDAAQVVQFLSDKAFGFGVTLKVPSEVRLRTAQIIRATAPRHGFTVGIKSTREGFRVFKQEPKELDEKVVEMAHLRAEEGMTLAAIGQRFNMTRERVRQLTQGVKKFSSLPSGERSAAFLEFCEPYIKAVGESPRCIVCLEINGVRHAGVCTDCHSMIRVLTQVGSRIRRYRKNGDRIELSNALKYIRKHNLKPEDLVLM